MRPTAVETPVLGPLTWLSIVLLAAALALLVAFFVVDYIAHVTHYQNGSTFSAVTWWLEERSLIARAVVTVFCAAMSGGGVLLFLHLALRLF